MHCLKFLALVGILLAFFLRIHSLGDKNVWWDEGLAIWAVRQGWIETTLWTAGDVHPPLYFWLLWFWVRITGETEFFARYLTVIAAALTAAVVFALAHRLGGPEAGLLALWFLAISRFHIWWSQEMRMYALVSLFFALSAYFALKAATSDSWKSWAGWIISCTAALYTLYSAVFLLPVCAIPALVRALERPGQRKLLVNFTMASGIVILLWVPWLLLALPRMKSWAVVEEPPSIGFVFKLNAVLLATGISTHLERLFPFGLFVVIMAVVGLPILLREDWRSLPGLLMLLGGVLLQPVTVWALLQPRSIFYVPKLEARYFIPASPLFYSLLAISLVKLSKKLRFPGLLLTTGALFLMAAFLPQYYIERDWEDDIPMIVRLIQVHGRPGDGVILISGDRFPEFGYYYNSPSGGVRFPLYTAPRLSSTLFHETIEAELGWIIDSHPRVWLAAIKPFLQDPEGVAVKWLSEKMKKALEYNFKLDSLYLFSHKDEPATPSREVKPLTPLEQELSPGVKVLGYDLMDRVGKQGTTIHLGLFMELEKPALIQVEAVSPRGFPFLVDSFALEPGYHYRLVSFKIALSELGSHRLRVRTGSEAIYLGEVKVKWVLSGPYAGEGTGEIKHPLSVRIGESIKLVGYNLVGVGEPPALRPGETLILELFWETEAPVERSYTVFTHLLGPVLNPATGKPVWAQDDQEPLEGLYPTTHWLPNVRCKDRYELTLPPNAPPGDYILEVGMYLRETGERLPVSGEGADPESRRVILGIIKVED